MKYMAYDFIQSLSKRHIICFNIYGKFYNEKNKRKVKVKRAQSMLQVMYKDICKYLPYSVGDFE